MPSIQQVIAEIQLAPDLPPHHITKVVNIIKEAEQRLKIKGVNSKPRKITNAKNLMTVREWEDKFGVLRWQIMRSWIESNNLDRLKIAEMLAEFFDEMDAKGKQYADFRAAFKVYLVKGYLSKKFLDCVKKEHTCIDNRGVTL